MQSINFHGSTLQIQDCELERDDLAFVMIEGNGRENFKGIAETNRATRDGVGHSDLRRG